MDVPDELVPLCADFPDWQFGVRWTAAANGPDGRTLFAWRDGVTLTAADAGCGASSARAPDDGGPGGA